MEDIVRVVRKVGLEGEAGASGEAEKAGETGGPEGTGLREKKRHLNQKCAEDLFVLDRLYLIGEINVPIQVPHLN